MGIITEAQIQRDKDSMQFKKEPMIPLSILVELKREIKRLRNFRAENYDLEDYCENFDARIIFRDDVFELIDRKVKEYML